MKNIKISFRYLLLLSFSLISMLFIVIISDIRLQLIIFSIYTISSLMILKIDLLHPSFIFASCYFLYSISYPTLYVLDIDTRYGCSPNLLRYELLGLCVYLLTVGVPKKISLKLSKINQNNKIDKKIWNCILFVQILLTIGTLLVLKYSGFSHKTEIYQNSLLTIMFSLVYIYIFFTTYMTIEFLKNEKKINWIYLIFGFVSFSFIGLVSGERDIAFTSILILTFCLYYSGKFNNKHLILIIPLSFFALLYSTQFKYFFLSGSNISNLNIANIEDLLQKFFNAEFISASRNMQLVLNKASEGVLGINTLFSDIIKVFYSNIDTSLTWFNTEIYYHANVGYGFTLVGEGYVALGAVGVILVFYILGNLMKYIYLRAENNSVMLAMYLNLIPLAVYSIRGNLSSIFSPFVKHLLIGAFIICIIKKFKIKNR